MVCCLANKNKEKDTIQRLSFTLQCFHLAILFIISFQMCHKVIAVYKMFLGGWREFKELWQSNQVSNLHFMWVLCECFKIVHKYNNYLVIIFIVFDKNICLKAFYIYLFPGCILNHMEITASKCWHLPDLGSIFYNHGCLNSWLFQFSDIHGKFALLFWNILCIVIQKMSAL